jgi:hypothetical protein
MTEDPRTPEEQADDLLEEWARSQAQGHQQPGDILRKDGILNRRRLREVHSREIPMSRFPQLSGDKPEDDVS